MYFVFNQGRLIVGISLPDDDGIGIRGGHTVVIKEYDENSDAYKLMDSGDETAKAVPRNRQTVLQQLMLYVADNIDFDTLDGPMLDATNLFESYYKENDEISWALPVTRGKKKPKWLLDDDAYSLEFKYTRQGNNATQNLVVETGPNVSLLFRLLLANPGTKVKPQPVSEASLETITEVSHSTDTLLINPRNDQSLESRKQENISLDLIHRGFEEIKNELKTAIIAHMSAGSENTHLGPTISGDATVANIAAGNIIKDNGIFNNNITTTTNYHQHFTSPDHEDAVLTGVTKCFLEKVQEINLQLEEVTHISKTYQNEKEKLDLRNQNYQHTFEQISNVIDLNKVINLINLSEATTRIITEHPVEDEPSQNNIRGFERMECEADQSNALMQQGAVK